MASSLVVAATPEPNDMFHLRRLYVLGDTSPPFLSGPVSKWKREEIKRACLWRMAKKRWKTYDRRRRVTGRTCTRTPQTLTGYGKDGKTLARKNWWGSSGLRERTHDGDPRRSWRGALRRCSQRSPLIDILFRPLLGSHWDLASQHAVSCAYGRPGDYIDLLRQTGPGSQSPKVERNQSM